MHQIAVSSSGELDPSALGRLVVDAARDLLGGNDATLLWWDAVDGTLTVLADTFARPYARRLAPGQGTAGIAFQRGEQVVVEDYPNWEHALPDALERGMKSVAAVPLVVRDKPVGALTVSFTTPRRFRDSDMRLLMLLGAQVAPALEAARLHDTLLRMSAELQEATEAKSRFLANMSHELRTPLNAILGFSELMIDDASGKYDATTRQKFLAQINSSGKHLLNLINDILDLSKVEAGQMSLKLDQVAIVDVVREVVSLIEPLATKKRIAIKAEVAGAGQLEADAGKVKQMLLNLVSNAVKFTPEAGAITIESHRLQDSVEISVGDTGIGISESDLGRLFKEFQQLDIGAGRRQEGTGLGLALTKRLAELHGGDIQVASQPGKGSTFTIRLPLRPIETPNRVTVPRSAAHSDARPLVLVVEDDHQAAELLVRQLDSGGFRAEIALSGNEALAKARELKPAAITLDILLPGIDGWDVMERLKRDEATRDIPVVIISVVDKPELGRALGAMDYFVKPVDGKALLARLAKYAFMKRAAFEETRILVVDDEPANLEWLEGVLKPAGFSVTSAHGGREGIELARKNLPHLVLLDLMMPEVSGFDVVEALQEQEATRAIPIMVLTAKDLTDDDKRQLNGHVAAIVARRSTAATDLMGWLNRLIAARH